MWDGLEPDKMRDNNYDELSEILSSHDLLEDEVINKIDLINSFACLNDTQKFLVIEFHFRGKSLKDISAETGMTEEQVKNRKMYALRKLREAL